MALEGEKDAKLLVAAKRVRALVAEGFRPIVFCRFIPTAEYVARELRARLGKGVEVAAVTGLLPPAERDEWRTYYDARPFVTAVRVADAHAALSGSACTR